MLRLDQLLVARGLVRSRNRAQRLIKKGCVAVTDEAGHVLKSLTRPGEQVAETILLKLEEDQEERYVSRAGLKLERLLTLSGLSLEGMTLLDIGQSTGGFTDCALQHGARRVIGIEVGHDQLATELRHDERVICLESINARALPASVIDRYAPQGVDGILIDVSFISQTLLLPALVPLLNQRGHLLTLVKPQFELTRKAINSKGLVRNPDDYAQVEMRVRQSCTALGLKIVVWGDSPITGSDGNREFLLYARKE